MPSDDPGTAAAMDALARVRAMKLTRRELETVAHYLAGYSPAGVLHALHMIADDREIQRADRVRARAAARGAQ